MRVLLDTHVWLWMLTTPDRLRSSTVVVLQDATTQLFLSAASSWEISIKYRTGRLPLPEPPARFIAPRLVRDGIDALAVELQHTVAVAELPDHHRDPFDRLLVAQARVESLLLCTADRKIQQYEVEVLLA